MRKSAKYRNWEHLTNGREDREDRNNAQYRNGSTELMARKIAW
jgi:hypothetical protein